MTTPGVGSAVTVQTLPGPPGTHASQPPAEPEHSALLVQAIPGEFSPRSKAFWVWQVLQVSPFFRWPPCSARRGNPALVMPWHEPQAAWVTTCRPEAFWLTPNATASWASTASRTLLTGSRLVQ